MNQRLKTINSDLEGERNQIRISLRSSTFEPASVPSLKLGGIGMLGVLGNFPLSFMSFGMRLISASADGKLTLDEIIECLDGDSLGEGTAEITEAIQAASADGHISILEVMNIASTVLARLAR